MLIASRTCCSFSPILCASVDDTFYSLCDVAKDSGKLTGRVADSDMHDVGRFLNRILGLPPKVQNRSVICKLSTAFLVTVSRKF